MPPKRIRTPAKPILPEIPEEVKSQLPLGFDAIVASGKIFLDLKLAHQLGNPFVDDMFVWRTCN